MPAPFFISERKEFDNPVQLTAYYALLVYIVSLFSEYIPVITNVMMGIFVLCALILAFQEKFIGFLSKKNSVLIGFLIFFIIEIVSAVLSHNKKEGFAILAGMAPFALFAFSFCFIRFSQTILNRILFFYAVSTTIASIVGLGGGVYDTVTKHDTGYMYNDNICFILGKQAVYFAYYVGAALFIFIIQLQQQQIGKKYRGWIYLAIIWLFVILFLLASRMAMGGILIITSIYIIHRLIKQAKYMELTILALGLIIGSVALIKIFPKTLNRFQGTTETNFQFDNNQMENHFNAEYDSTKWNGTNTRAAIWTCALEVWRTNRFLGTAIGDKGEALKKKYEEKEFHFALITKKNTHNQYLDILMGMGIIGLIAFICCYFIYPVSYFIKEGNTLAVMIFTLFALCLATENMFARYQGVALLAFILPLVSKVKSENGN